MPNLDLQEWTDFVLGTGCRDGEALATRWCDLDLDSDTPTVHVCGTVIEPRDSYVAHLHRQATSKSRSDRTLILSDHVATLLQARARKIIEGASGSPGVRHRRGELRAVADDELLRGTSPHTLRRSVGTLIAHPDGLDAARDQLGHSDPSVTFRHYVGRRHLAPDLRETLDQFFGPLPATDPMNSATPG